MSWFGTILGGLRARGVGGAIHAARRRIVVQASRLGDAAFDRRYATETRRIVENDAMRDVSTPNLSRGIRYEPTRARPFRRLLAAARIPPRGTFVDLGCGKGRVLILAAAHGFRRVTGVDYSPALCERARRNIAAFRAASGLSFEATIHAVDAAGYAFQADETVVFLFNPFDGVVLSRVIDNLRASLFVHPRPVWLIYHNPVWRSTIEGAGLFDAPREYSFGGCDFAVYRTR